MKQDSSKGRGEWEIYSESLHVFPNAKETSPFARLCLPALFRTELTRQGRTCRKKKPKYLKYLDQTVKF